MVVRNLPLDCPDVEAYRCGMRMAAIMRVRMAIDVPMILLPVSDVQPETCLFLVDLVRMSVTMVVTVTMSVSMMVVSAGSVHSPQIDRKPNRRDEQQLASFHFWWIETGGQSTSQCVELGLLTLSVSLQT